MLYWHWLALGLALLMAEMFLASFFVFWFGLGALLVGLLTWLRPDVGLTVQLLAWTVSSGLFTGLWFRFLPRRSFPPQRGPQRPEGPGHR